MPVKTPERVAEARRLKDAGWTGLRIADHFGVANSTVHDWLKDPTGRRLRERKARCAGHCIDCGEPTSGSEGRHPHRCCPCAWAAARTWTEDAIVAAIKAWVAEHGEPPVATDWTKAQPGYPTTSTCQSVFGNWNAAIEAAGFAPRPIGHHRRPSRKRVPA